MVEPNKRTISHTVREIFIQLFVIFYTAILNLSLKSDGVRVKGGHFMLCEIPLRIPIWRRHPGDEVEWRVDVCHTFYDLDCS